MLLAAEGASVVVNDRGGEWDGAGADERPAQLVADEINAAGGTAVANYDDIASWDGAKGLIDQAVETFGGLDILVCNAGILRDRMVWNLSEAEWDDVVGVHLKGHVAPTRFAAAYWRERWKATGEPVNGRIVYTSSEAGIYGNAGQTNYSAAKGGIISLGWAVARELERIGVTCNSICPRARTRLTEGTFGAFTAVEGAFDAWDPDNVAPWVVYLCTEAARHISGQTFIVNGGLVELLEPWRSAATITKDGRWSVKELVDAQVELFGDRSAGIAPMPGLDDLLPAIDSRRV